MSAGSIVAYFFAGAFLTNAIPHFVSGLMVGWVLVTRVGSFDLHNVFHVAVLAAGCFAIGTHAARSFGRFHGGNEPERT